MKLSAFTILFILSFFTEKVLAQQRFIEVSAADTIVLKPVKFTCRVSLNSTSNYGYDYNPSMRMDTGSTTVMGMSKPEKNKTSVTQVMNLLKNAGYHYTVGEESNYATYGYNNNNDSNILVTVLSADEVKKLFHLLKTLSDVSSSISHIDYETAPAAQNTWYKSLYEKAKASATLLAQASGNTLGQLISVEEDKNLVSQAVEEIRKTEEEIGKVNFYRTDFKKELYKRMLFKFEMK